MHPLSARYNGRMAKREPNKPGPEPDRLQIEGEWEEAVDRALDKKRPVDGWPQKGPDRDTHKQQARDCPSGD